MYDDVVYLYVRVGIVVHDYKYTSTARYIQHVVKSYISKHFETI